MAAHAGEVMVLVAASPTLRETVAYAVDAAFERADERPPVVRFVTVIGSVGIDATGEQTEERAAAAELLERVTDWAREDADGAEIDVRTSYLGEDAYISTPSDIARSLLRKEWHDDVGLLVLDPSYDPAIETPVIRPLRVELGRLGGIEVKEAPVVRQVRRTPILHRTSPRRIAGLAGLSFVFYQLLVGEFSYFDIATGAMTAIVVAAVLSHVTLSRDPDRHTAVRLLRMVLYVPYLLYEIVRANIEVAAVILHPRMPIDPQLTRVQAFVWGGLPLTTLANSITLTPGTLTVRIDGRTLLVHTLIPDARESLFDGSLERAVRFLFYGRAATRISSPRERDEADVVAPDAPIHEEPVQGESG